MEKAKEIRNAERKQTYNSIMKNVRPAEIGNLSRMEENRNQWRLNQIKNIYGQLNKSKTRGGRKNRKSRKSKKSRKTRKH